jgi:hypothetical protein
LVVCYRWCSSHGHEAEAAAGRVGGKECAQQAAAVSLYLFPVLTQVKHLNQPLCFIDRSQGQTDQDAATATSLAAGDNNGDDDDMLVDETDKIQARALAELKSNAIDLLDDEISASAVMDRLGPIPAPAAATVGAAAASAGTCALSTGGRVVVKAEKRVV